MQIITEDLHNEINRNHSPKCLSWDGSNTTSKIVCTDSNRSVRRSSDWSIACLFNNNGNFTLPCIYSDYLSSTGIFIGINNSSENLNIIVRNVASVVLYLGDVIKGDWVTLILSYNSSANKIEAFVNGKNLGNLTVPGTNEWATSSDFGLYSIPSTFSNNLLQGSFSTYCILDSQATNEFVESFNTFGVPDTDSHDNVTFFTNLDKVNDQGTYTGLECSTKFFNPSSTTKEIEFVGWTDENLGLNTDSVGITPNCLLKDFYTGETEDAYGLDMGRLWEEFRSSSSTINIYMEGGSVNHATNWTNGWTVSWKGNLAKTEVNVSNITSIPWFVSSSISLRANDLGQVYVSQDGVGSKMITQVSNMDQSNIYTLTANTNGDYKLFINGVKANEDNLTYTPLNNNINPIVIGVLSPQRFYKYYQGIRVYDKVLTETEASSVLGSELDSYVPLCSYSTNMDSSSRLIDNTGNLNVSSSFDANNFVDTVVDTNSGFQSRRKGLKFESSKRHYLKIPSLPQIDVNKGITLIMLVKDFAMPSARTLSWFTDETSVNDLVRVLYRTGTPNVLGFNSSTLAGSEIRLEVDANESNRLIFKASNESQTEPKNTFNKIASVNNITETRVQSFSRNGSTYDLFIGGIPGDDLPSFGTAQYCDITIEGFILVNGVMDDHDINKIITTDKIGNVPLELQNKYDFEVIADFNNVYDDSGVLKVKDLSGNDHDIIARGSGGFGWNTLSELQASQVNI